MYLIYYMIEHWDVFDEDFSIPFRMYLHKHFSTLPKTVNLMYFVKGLGLEKEYEKRIKSRSKMKTTQQAFAF